MLDQHAVGYSEFAQSMNWLGTPLGGRARVEQELTRVTLLVHRRMAVAEHDYIRVGKTAPHPRAARPVAAPVSWTIPIRTPPNSTTRLMGSTPTRETSLLPSTAWTGASSPNSSRTPASRMSPACKMASAPRRHFHAAVRQSRANAAAWPGGPDVSVGEDDDSNATGGGPCCHRRQDREPLPPGVGPVWASDRAGSTPRPGRLAADRNARLPRPTRRLSTTPRASRTRLAAIVTASGNEPPGPAKSRRTSHRENPFSLG